MLIPQSHPILTNTSNWRSVITIIGRASCVARSVSDRPFTGLAPSILGLAGKSSMNKVVITERIIEAIRTCENTLRLQEDPFIEENSKTLHANLREIDGAHCKSWLGYHACVYYRDFYPPAPGDHFSSEWGLMRSSQNWVEYPPEAVEMAAMTGVTLQFQERLTSISKRAEDTFAEAHDTVLIISDILVDQEGASTLARLRDDIRKLKGRTPVRQVINTMMPTGSFISRDSAVTQGVRCPPHSKLSATQISLSSPFIALDSLVKSSKSLLKYMEIHDLADRSTLQRAERVFIGHGRSPVWRELKDFLQDRLGLPWEEFNREPAAGVATTDRLQEMLDRACFAFLVMTAEDEHADASLHARENVIHEVGLFQGRLGFPRAIVLLEEGCAVFSNIVGCGQIRFVDDISTKFEEIRRVLEREGII